MTTINISFPETITDLNLGSTSVGSNSQKLGGTVNISEFVALTSFVCIDNDINYDDEFNEPNVIRVFNVKGNNITKFPRFEIYPKLRNLNFSNNSIQELKFETNVFDTLSASLRRLDISDNVLRGAIPSLSALSVLTSVNLSGNGFSSYTEVSSSEVPSVPDTDRLTVAGFTGDDEHLNGVYEGDATNGYSQISPTTLGSISREDTSAATEEDFSIVNYYWNILDGGDNSPGSGDVISNSVDRSDSSPTILYPYQMTWSGGITVERLETWYIPSQIGLYNENLTYLNLRDNTLSASGELNALLLNLSGSGGVDGFLDVSGPFMPKPSDLGLSARNSLLSEGWNVRSNELSSVEFARIWDFPSPVSANGDPFEPQTVSWRISGYENMPITLDLSDGTPNQSLTDNLSTEHTFVSGTPFTGVRYSLPHRIEKFVSRLSGGDFGTTSYPVSGNVDLSQMPGLLEVFIGDHHATFTNFNKLSRKLTQFYWWNNNVTDSFVDMNIARLPKLVTFSARGKSSSNKGDFTGELHSAVPPSLSRYNVQHNSLSGRLPTFTTDFNNINIYFINSNENIVGEIPDMAEFGKNRTSKDVQFLANKCSLSGVTADFTVNSKLKSIKLMRNDFTTATLDQLMARLVASDLRGCTVDTRLQSTGQTVTPGNADLATLRSSSRGNTMEVS